METVTVYFDYICPYAKRSMELASMIEKPLNLTFIWKHYSLHQAHYKGTDNWQLWQDELTENKKNGGKGLLPFLAAYAAEKQNDPFTNFRLKMFQSYHNQNKPYSLQNILDLAEQANLNIEQFKEDLNSQDARNTLQDNHTEAISKHVAASPTVFFESGAASYFRFKDLPQTQEEAEQFFTDYKNLIENYPYLETLRRPLDPQTKPQLKLES